MRERTNCPQCGISFVGEEIPNGLYQTGLYGSMAKCKDIARDSYGWTPENKMYFIVNCVFIINKGKYSQICKCNNCGKTCDAW